MLALFFFSIKLTVCHCASIVFTTDSEQYGPDEALLLQDVGGEALDLAVQMTRHSVESRLTAAQALDHPFFASPCSRQHAEPAIQVSSVDARKRKRNGEQQE
jgi:hypothetical protein